MGCTDFLHAAHIAGWFPTTRYLPLMGLASSDGASPVLWMTRQREWRRGSTLFFPTVRCRTVLDAAVAAPSKECRRTQDSGKQLWAELADSPVG